MRITITEGEFTISGAGDPGDDVREAAEALARLLNSKRRPGMTPAALGRFAETAFEVNSQHAVLFIAEMAAAHRCIPPYEGAAVVVANALGRIAQATYGLDAGQVEAMLLPYCEAVGVGRGGERPHPAPHPKAARRVGESVAELLKAHLKAHGEGVAP